MFHTDGVILYEYTLSMTRYFCVHVFYLFPVALGIEPKIDPPLMHFAGLLTGNITLFLEKNKNLNQLI